MTRTTNLRLLITAAMTLMLLTCTVAAWAMPHTRPHVSPGQAAGVAAVGDRCHLIAGPARDVCRSAPEPVTSPRPAAAAAVWPAALDGSTVLLLFSTVAVAAAIALVTMAERRL
ncbi:hypothetical protein AB0N28_00935 [Streptomyces sp. NPDC051130]|uniref:hypothetical protein n=1 Tax=Streptomyces sp. NPDC051130 TaxID=3157223 RepID=UPI003426965E